MVDQIKEQIKPETEVEYTEENLQQLISEL